MYREVKEVSLDSHIKLLDGPGVVFAQKRTDAVSVLSNCINVSLFNTIILLSLLILMH